MSREKEAPPRTHVLVAASIQKQRRQRVSQAAAGGAVARGGAPRTRSDRSHLGRRIIIAWQKTRIRTVRAHPSRLWSSLNFEEAAACKGCVNRRGDEGFGGQGHWCWESSAAIAFGVGCAVERSTPIFCRPPLGASGVAIVWNFRAASGAASAPHSAEQH